MRRLPGFKRLLFLGVALFVAASGLMFLFSQRSTQAAVKINDASNFNLLSNHTRPVVRTSSGTLYVLMIDSTNVTCEMWKSSDGSSWSEVGTAPLCFTSQYLSMAIDSSNLIHWIFGDDGDGNLKYNTFNTSSDSFGTEEDVVASALNSLQAGIAIDSNNIPHVAYSYTVITPASYEVKYTNRIGGTWKSPVSVDTDGLGSFSATNITFNEDNIAEIAYLHQDNFDLSAAVGNVNNASSFTVFDVDTTVSGTIVLPTIAVDSSGNSWIAYSDENGATDFVTLVKHNDADGWTTWQTPVTNSNAGTSTSIVAKGTDIYVLYIDENSDVKYDRYSGSWLGETNLQTGTFFTVTAKWAYFNDNQQSSQIDYLFSDGTDIWWDKLNLNVPPNAPTLSSPADGATIAPLTGNSFQSAATDPDSDTLKYHIKIFNTTAQSGGNCSGSVFEEQDQNVAQGGWSQAGAYTSGATATYSNQTSLVRGSSYCWQTRAKDPTGSNTFGNWSTPRTLTVNSIPATPTLNIPAASATQISVLPLFELRTTDADSDYLKYNIKVYSNSGGTGESNCNADSATNLLRNIDQTALQTGWTHKDADSGNSYIGSSSIGNSSMARHFYQPAVLTPNTVYYWKGRAIDPGGASTFGSWATCQGFTTATYEVQIQGGVEIRGGTTFQ